MLDYQREPRNNIPVQLEINPLKAQASIPSSFNSFSSINESAALGLTVLGPFHAKGCLGKVTLRSFHGLTVPCD